MPAWQVERVAVVVSADANVVGAEYARRYPFARVDVLLHSREAPDRSARQHRRVRIHHTRNLDQIRLRLQAMPPLDVLVDAARTPALKAALLRHLIFQVADGGQYVVSALDRQLGPVVGDDTELDVRAALDRIRRVQADPAVIDAEGWSRDEQARADAVADIRHDGSTIVLRKAGAHAVRLHDWDTDVVLRGRNGPDWGRVLETREPVDPAIPRPPHANRLVDTFRTSMPVPRMHLREYRDVVCAPRQLAVQGDAILPISYHHGLGARLRTRSPLVTPVDAHYALLDPSLDDAEPLPGTYFHFDSEFPGHFGHLMTEDIAKLWGWEPTRVRWPDARILVSTIAEGGRPLTVHRAVLAAWGVDPDDITVIDRPVRVERLVGATQMFYNGIYVHPEMLDVWARLREALRTPAAERTPQPPRIFVTRPPETTRVCRNAADVESLFAEHGFAIVRPELLSLREQVDLFAEAEFVAGFGGSGMFGALYAERPGRRIVISSDHYKARNEWAIAAAKGDDYHHFFGEPEIAPGTAEGWRVFHSPFTFDFERDGEALRRLLG